MERKNSGRLQLARRVARAKAFRCVTRVRRAEADFSGPSREHLAGVDVSERVQAASKIWTPNDRNWDMLDTAFASPIVVLVGMGFPLEIRSVIDALGYLDGQPAVLRDEAFHATYGACRDALEGKSSVSEARDVVCALARRRGALVEETWIPPLAA